MGRCLGISMNSKSDWLKSESEHYQHAYQRMGNASLPVFAQMADILNIHCQQLHD